MIISETDLLRKALSITTEIERINENLHRLLTTTSSQDSSKVSHVSEEVISKKSPKASKLAKTTKAAKPTKAIKPSKTAKVTKIASSVSKKLAKKSSAKGSKSKRKPYVFSASGPLSDAVLKVLEETGVPMKVKEIFTSLEKQGYQWTNDQPLRQLYARIAKLPGAVRVGDGEYALKKNAEAPSKTAPPTKEAKEVSTTSEISTSSDTPKEEVVPSSNLESQESSPSLEKPTPSSDVISETTENIVIAPEKESAATTNTATTSFIY